MNNCIVGMGYSIAYMRALVQSVTKRPYQPINAQYEGSEQLSRACAPEQVRSRTEELHYVFLRYFNLRMRCRHLDQEWCCRQTHRHCPTPWRPGSSPNTFQRPT